MNLLKRLNNIWKLGELEITPEKQERLKELIKPHKMAVIIKRANPVQEFLENESKL